jgi:hypothetical protein
MWYSIIQVPQDQTRRVSSTLQDTIRGSYPADWGEQIRPFTHSLWPINIFSRVRENVFQTCRCPFSKPPTNQQAHGV